MPQNIDTSKDKILRNGNWQVTHVLYI